MNISTEIIATTEHLQEIPADIAYHYGIFPKSFSQDILTIYVKEKEVETVPLEELELILGKKIRYETAPANHINKALSKYYRSITSVKSKEELTLAGDFLENLIRDAKATQSSDIHFEIFKDSARVRFRIDGKLIERNTIKKEDYAELVNKIKIKSNLNITEKRLPQDGRINYNDFDIRVSILPTLHGEKIVMRILGKDTSNLTIERLGMSQAEKKTYLQAVYASKGIILISGPTGSGKTTTLYATIKLLNKLDSNILTIEDPIEYTMEGINQVQLKEDIGLSFSSALKTFLRQDPDIIMLGEIRDQKTAQMAIRASLTGHLVFSTIHTNSALGTITRLIDMGVPPFLIAETLKISVAQRLVRRLCKSCKVEASEIDVLPDGIPFLEKHYLAKGCNDCHHTGYKGRIAIYELIPINHKIIEIIKSGIQNSSQSLQYEKLSEKAIKLVAQGITTFEEVYAILIEDRLDT